jgi:hypothetical protein
MCTIHADSSAGVFRRIASYAVQSPERLPVEASALLTAGALHFVVFLDSDVHDLDDADAVAPTGRDGEITRFAAPVSRSRFVSSIREVVDAEAGQVVSNEIFAPGPDRRARPAAPLQPRTAAELAAAGARVPSGSSGSTARGGARW